MTILRERQSWRKSTAKRLPRGKRDGSRTGLTAEQAGNVRAALRVLLVRYGSSRKLARAMAVYYKAIERVLRRYRRPTVLMARKAAELAGVTPEELASGEFPKPGSCPLCGRTG